MTKTFVELADTLVDDFDQVGFIRLVAARCVEQLAVPAAGLLLVDHAGALHTAGVSRDGSDVRGLMAAQQRRSPSLECHRTGERLTVRDLPASLGRWPRFASAALAHGFSSVDVLPLRRRDQGIGALTLFGTGQGQPDGETIRIATALSDVVTISLLQRRAVHRQATIGRQLQRALDSRVLIEQAKGILTERFGIDMDVAFTALRGYCRRNNRRLTEVAAEIVRDLDAADELGPSRNPFERRIRPRTD
ncbi:GAF and ANTAR domain-containing protein [Solihabitans fulvus]|uniref:GAF and ANTAR domain-containing protein n=1 Tax=Solihabitans fulvus TaxID=1892852 RepID=A0A5B2XGH3_9PSEU|nr:GAF and ANTAR domain-containing protein [Solihabitans fulvus]